jgi:hypothetical protein
MVGRAALTTIPFGYVGIERRLTCAFHRPPLALLGSWSLLSGGHADMSHAETHVSSSQFTPSSPSSAQTALHLASGHTNRSHAPAREVRRFEPTLNKQSITKVRSSACVAVPRTML